MILKKTYKLFLSLLFLFIGLSFFAQTYNFKNYNTAQGLPQSQVLSIFQDHSGFMWFGTNGGGVGKYDGSKFTTFSDNDGLTNNVVFSVIENNKHEMLFGTSKGLSIYNGLIFTTYNQKNGLKNSYIFKLLKDDNTVWIGTAEGVYQFENNLITQFDKDSILNNSSIYNIYIDDEKNIWFATLQNGAIFYNKKTHQFKHFNYSLGLMSDFVFSISQTSKGDILIGTQQGLNTIDKQFNVKPLDSIKYNRNIAFSCLLQDSDSEFYFGSHSEGITKFNFISNTQTARFNLLNGLTNNPIQCLFKDREGNLWIGTDGSGVYKYSNDKFIYYTKFNGLSENYINTVATDHFGNLWLALKNNGLLKINSKENTPYKLTPNTKNSIPDNDINTILPLSDGRIFFGTKEGLSCFENGTFNIVKSGDFKSQYILSLFQDKQKTIWIGTTEGIYTYKNSIITPVNAINKFKQDGLQFLILCINQDKNGAIWIGTENGLIKYIDGKVTFYDKKNTFISNRIKAIELDSKNNLWIGSGEGLFHFDYNSFTKISQKNGLSSNNILSMKIDNTNHLVVGLNSGIDVLDINDYYNHKITTKHFSKDDGLLDLESNFNAMYKDNSGRLLIGTIAGLEIYNPKYDKKNTIEAITTIETIKLFFGQEDILKYAQGLDSITLLPKNLQLPFNKNHITFQFIGVSLTSPEKVMYQYKLEGLDDDWTPATSKTEATYSSLPPGKYKFSVKAMNNDGLWNKEPISYEFSISPPWYNTWWFYTICVILLISGIWLYNFIHTKKLIADKQKLERTVDERTHELREEKEKVESINKEVIQQKSIIEHKNIEITDSIKYAKNIQEALLPSLNEIGNLFQHSFVLYMPKDIVSGDFYWFAKNGNTRFIAAVDCTGHGVPGAFMSIVGNTLLNEIVNEKKITVPGDILLELHKGVKIALNQNAMEFERRDGMDITLCSFNEDASEIQYAGANRPLWIYRKDRGYELEIIKATKFPIGGLELEETRVYQNHVVKVNKGDCIYLFSDGYADQFGGPKGKKFMLTNLQKTLLENVESPMDVQKHKLTAAFMDWKSDAEQIDDVLVIGIRI